MCTCSHANTHSMKSPLLAWGWKMGAEAGSNLSEGGLSEQPSLRHLLLCFLLSSIHCVLLSLSPSFATTCPFHSSLHPPNVTPLLTFTHTRTASHTFHFLWKHVPYPSPRCFCLTLTLSNNTRTGSFASKPKVSVCMYSTRRCDRYVQWTYSIRAIYWTLHFLSVIFGDLQLRRRRPESQGDERFVFCSRWNLKRHQL